MNADQYGSRATRILGEPSPTNQVTGVPFLLFPGTFTSNIWDPRDFHDAGSRAALLAGVESQRNLYPPTFDFPAARSGAERMPTLEQHLAFLMKEEQRCSLPLTIEQQLASFIGEQQGKTTEHELAFLTEQQQVRHQSFEAAKEARDRMTIDELLAPLKDRMPTIEHHFASMIQATNSASQSSCFPSNLLTKRQPSVLPSLENLQLMRQLQHGLALQTQAGGCYFGHAEGNQYGSHHVGPLVEVRRDCSVPTPPSVSL
jgi:hypothetical protein